MRVNRKKVVEYEVEIFKRNGAISKWSTNNKAVAIRYVMQNKIRGNGCCCIARNELGEGCMVEVDFVKVFK